MRKHLAQPEQEPVAHCEGGSEFCPVCRAETRSLALAAAVGYVQRNTPSLVSIEICNALNHIVDANKMLEALRGIGDFAHDKSTGPEVPDALWEIRSMAYGAMENTRQLVPAAQPKEPEQSGFFSREAMKAHSDGHVAQPEPNAVTYKEVTDTMNSLYMGDSKQVQMAMMMERKKLYTTPPQRKPLTDEQIDLIDSGMCGDREFYRLFARAIEAAHNIKE